MKIIVGNNVSRQKLRLRKETLRELSYDHLAAIAGGVGPSVTTRYCSLECPQ